MPSSDDLRHILDDLIDDYDQTRSDNIDEAENARRIYREKLAAHFDRLHINENDRFDLGRSIKQKLHERLREFG